MPHTDRGPPLSGDLVTVSFWSDRYVSTIQSEYDELIAKHGPNRVLILNRYPGGTQELEDRLAREVQGIERPRVRVLSQHAERVLEELEHPPTVLGDDERIVLVREFLDSHEWESQYLSKAAEKPGFRSDFLRFVVSASYQHRPDPISDDVLRELYDAVDAYHGFCRHRLPAEHDLDRGFIDRSGILVSALELLSEPDIREAVCRDFDAVLALEFEEFDATSRAYLETLTRDCDLVAVAQESSAIRRPFSEPGSITDLAGSMTHRPIEKDRIANPLQALSAYLGATSAPDVPLSTVARRIDGDTFQGHVQAIGRKIEELHQIEGIPYDEIAVVLRDSNAPISETNSILRGQGLPTTSATVSGLEHDPASRELLAVVRWLAGEESGAGEGDSEREYDQDQALATLRSRITGSGVVSADEADTTIERALEAAAGAPDVHAGLWRWIVHSNLKERVASRNDPLEARIRFGHVRQLADLISFLARDVIEADWSRVVTEFEDRYDLESRERISNELDTINGAVRVDVARAVKTLDFDRVFLVGLVEGEYPAEPRFGSLFSRTKLQQLPEFTTVTTPSTETVIETFPPAADEQRHVRKRDPLEAYYGEISRRMLAIGTRVARERVYFCTYEQERGLGRRRQPSRFLAEIEERFEEIEPVEQDVLETTDPVEFATTRLETALDRILSSAVQNQPIDLEAMEREFGAVQRILETTDDPELRRAVEAKVDFARGRVRRD